MSRATEDDLGSLHGAVAKALTTIIEDGVEVVGGKDDEGNPVIVKVPASAAYFTAAIGLLKNNDITASASDNDAVRKLKEALEKKRSKTVAPRINPMLDFGLDADGLVQ